MSTKTRAVALFGYGSVLTFSVAGMVTGLQLLGGGCDETGVPLVLFGVFGTCLSALPFFWYLFFGKREAEDDE